MYFFDTLLKELADREIDKLEVTALKEKREAQDWLSKNISDAQKFGHLTGMEDEILSSLKKEKENIDLMEERYYRLKEKYKHENKTRVEIARDWKDYLQSVNQTLLSREAVGVTGEYKFYQELDKEDNIRIEETEKKFTRLLQ